MFNNIPIDMGIKACMDAWRLLCAAEFPDHPVSPELLGEIVKFILDKSWFLFLSEVYSIHCGTAMGQRHSVVLANCFMSFLLSHFFVDHPEWLAFIPHVWGKPFLRRLLDDIFTFWGGNRESFDRFVACLSTFCSDSGYGIQLEATGFGSNVHFLDLGIYCNPWGRWHSRIFSK